MLVLSRKNDEAVVIGGSDGFERIIKVTVVAIKNGRVRLGFEADMGVPVHRLEVWERISGLNATMMIEQKFEPFHTSCSLAKAAKILLKSNGFAEGCKAFDNLREDHRYVLGRSLNSL